MYDSVTKLFVALCVYGVSQSNATTAKFYTTSGIYKTTGTQPEYTLSSDTAGFCAILCNNADRCASFSFDKSSKSCILSEGLVSTFPKYSPRVEADKCQHDRGYNIYIREKNVLCLRFDGTTVTRNAAASECSRDEAHLVLIENNSMLQFVGDILTTNSWGEVWVDGYDADDDGNFTTFRGDPLPYVPPGSGMKEANSGFLCIRFQIPSNGSPYAFSDLDCHTHVRKMMCQIDV